MEKNNLNKAYIFIIAIFAIGIAISNIVSFFNGVGFALIGASLLLTLAIVNIVKDKSIKNRFVDIFVLIALELMMLIVLFFAYDFNLNGITNKFPLIMRNICAIYSLIAMCYVMFRYISEVNGKKYNFVETMLGNSTTSNKEKKVKLSKEEIKKNKELENGTFEPKPSSLNANRDAEVIASEPAEERIVEEESKVEELASIEEEQEIETSENGDEEFVIDETQENLSEDDEDNATETKPETTSTQTPNVTNRTNFWY